MGQNLKGTEMTNQTIEAGNSKCASAVEGTVYRFTLKGLNRLIAIDRTIERSCLKIEPLSAVESPDFVSKLVDAGYVEIDTPPLPGAILLTDLGLDHFVTMEQWAVGQSPMTWTVNECPDILVWMAEIGLVQSSSRTMTGVNLGFWEAYAGKSLDVPTGG